MRHPQLLVCERGGRLAGLLREPARERKWFFRARRQPESCPPLLLRGGPAVVVVEVGRGLADRSPERELGLLEELSARFPHAATVAVLGPGAEALAELAWDLGAGYVLFDGQVAGQLVDVVAGLMKSAVKASGIGG